MANYLFDAIRNAIPSHKAVFIETDTGKILTYGDMLRATARLANTLIDIGVRAGDRIVVQVEKSPEALLLYLACLRAGVVYLPLNTSYTPVELEYFIEDSKPALIVISPEKVVQLAPLALKAAAQIVTLGADGSGTLLETAELQSDCFADIDRQADDIAAILYTSGTTGRSKGAMLTHKNLLSNADTLREHWHFTAEDKLIHALPIFHTHGLFVATNVTLLAGSTIFLLSKFEPEKIFEFMPHATTMMGVPTFYTRLLEDKRLSAETTKHIRLFVSGSAPLLAETHHSFSLRTGHAILERYGMTETNMITSNPYDGARVSGSVGYALQGISVRITDPETETVMATGEPGMIEVKGPNVFSGYWNNPEKTKEEFRSDGYFMTGDIGTMDADGRVTIVGRFKDLIISGGYNIYPKEIEDEIDTFDGVIESAVVGVTHPDFGEGVVAIVVKHPDSAINGNTIMANLDGRIARFKQPKHIAFVEQLPRNSMGKVQKNLVRDQYKNIFE